MARHDHLQRVERMRSSLDGLSVGDAFGEQFFASRQSIWNRELPPGPWPWTDDTEMALSVYRILKDQGTIDDDLLALSFAEQFDPARGYGPAMVFQLLPALKTGADWRVAARSLFEGSGSFGNGAAMRGAPLGAFFSDDLGLVVENAERSAIVTHAHAEGVAGAIAVAVAAAIAVRQKEDRTVRGPRMFIQEVLPFVPESDVRHGLQTAVEQLGPHASPDRVAELVGNGGGVTAQDTVPFCLWMAGRYLDDYQEALWQTISVLGDMDTNCAIVGGIVAAHVGPEGIPEEWRTAREPLPPWPFA